MALQILLPLRHYAYPGSVFWTGEGLYFAWHMRGANAASVLELWSVDPVTGLERTVPYRGFLHRRQIGRMSNRPWMVHELSHHWADRIERASGRRPRVYVGLWTSLNGRKPQLKIDPDVDLAAEPRTLGPARWILPLEEPLPPGGDATAQPPSRGARKLTLSAYWRNSTTFPSTMR